MDRKPPLAKEYFIEQHALCCKYLRAYSARKSAENLHQLRVAIKKLRALLHMLHKIDPAFEYRKVFLPYKNVFKQAGAIREESLHRDKILKAIENYEPPNASLRLIDKRNKELISAIPRHLKNISKVEPEIFDGFEKLERKKILPYCTRLFKHLANKWKKIESEEDLHKFRKRLKQFIYCSHLLSDNEKAGIATAKKYTALDELQDILGKWHDNVLLLNKLSDDKLKVSARFVFALKHQTHQLLIKARKKGDKI
jgi:CHAD domain-containing protein